jgi:dihydroorotate dehydrogenase electron transfer subunit
MNIPQITKIIENRNETNDVKTIKFRYEKDVSPGQFLMIWIPGIDEIPMSVSYTDKRIKEITFKRVGEATNSLFDLKEGNNIGIRGPYGNGFEIKGQHILFVGGGTGIATIAPIVKESIMKNIDSTVVIGAKSKSELFFERRFKDYGAKLICTTDDGSAGYKGFASEIAKKILHEEKIDSIMTCGPELMMKSLLNYCDSVFFQASIERYIKCAIGICGQCCIGKGLRVCKEGPVFDGQILKDLEDFGVFRRDSSGKKVYL